MPPVFPSIQGSKIATGPANRHIHQVLHGKGPMPPFRNRLSVQEISDVITYQRNTWGNNDKNRYGKNAGGQITTRQVADYIKENEHE